MDDNAKKYRNTKYMPAKPVMMSQEIRSSMKTKVRDGHATIITCVTQMQGGIRHVTIVACPSLAFAFVLLLISHAIITGFACIYFTFLYF